MNKIKKWIDKIGEEEMDSDGLIGVYQNIVGKLPKDIKTTLSVGCGSGAELDYLPGEFIHGLDINPINESDSVKIGDMHDLPYEDDSFDLVYSRDSFEHSIAPIVALDEMARVSKRYVVIILPEDLWIESIWHIIIPNMRQLMALAEKIGLSLKYHRELNSMVNGFPMTEYMYLFKL